MKSFIFRLLVVGVLAFFATAGAGKFIQLNLDSMDKQLEAARAAPVRLDGPLGPEAESLGAFIKAEPSKNALYEKLVKQKALSGPFGRKSDLLSSINSQLSSEASDVKRLLLITARYSAMNKTKLIAILWLLPCVILALACAALLCSSYMWARFLGELSLRLSAFILLAASVTALVAYFSSSYAAYAFLSKDLFLAPVLFALFSALLLKRVDLNYPVWNRLAVAFACPVAVFVAIQGWGYALQTTSGPALR